MTRKHLNLIGFVRFVFDDFMKWVKLRTRMWIFYFIGIFCVVGGLLLSFDKMFSGPLIILAGGVILIYTNYLKNNIRREELWSKKV